MKRAGTFLAVMAFPALLAGCGGGGGGSTPIAALNAHTRALQAGDQWIYDVSGSTVNLSGQPVTASGSYTESVSVRSINGVNALALQTDVNLKTSDGQTFISSSQVYLTQDSSGNLVEIGDNNGGTTSVRTVTAPDVLYPGAWTSAYTHTANLTFNTGEMEQDTVAVTGTQAVTTPAGGFTTYVASVTNATSLSSGGGSASTQYWAPQLGAPVKIVLSSGGGGGTQPTITATLRSTTVPH